MTHPFTRMMVPLVAFALLVFGTGAAVAAPACTLGAPGITARVSVAGTGRSLLLHVPRHFDPATPAPLVFLLHGSGGDGAAILAESRLAGTADRAGFIVAAPDAGVPAGKGFAWNIPGVSTINGTVPDPDASDDTTYLKAAIRWLAANGCADRAQVYVTGLSGGGRMPRSTAAPRRR